MVTNEKDETWKKLKEQIGRLQGMMKFPMETAAKRDLVRALAGANDLAHAERVIDDVLESATSESRCPLPGEIRSLVSRGKLEHHPDQLCTICNGDGWRIVTRGVYSGAERCACIAPRNPPVYEQEPGFVLNGGGLQRVPDDLAGLRGRPLTHEERQRQNAEVLQKGANNG